MTMDENTRRVREASLGWLLQRVAGRFEARMSAALAPEGLTIQQFAVLMRVLEHGGETQNAIGAAFAMPPWAISRALDGLERAGLVRRSACPFSRRAHRVQPTEAARARAPALHAIIEAVNAEMAAPLGADERGQLHALLARLETEG